MRLEVSPNVCAMQSDPEKLRRIFTNLIENAGRHSRDVVEVSADLEDSFVVVEVSDLGPGLALEVADRVFEKGFSLGDERDSSGLGLWIVRELVIGLAGNVRALPHDPVGLTMQVRLPYVPGSPTSTLPHAGLGAARGDN